MVWLAAVASGMAILLGLLCYRLFQPGRNARTYKEKAQRFLQQAYAAKYHENNAQTSNNLIVVLDLDECLVHVNKDGRKMNPAPSIESFMCQFPALRRGTRSPQQQQYISCQVFLRPGWREFLEPLLSQPDRYEVHLFTASERDYAVPILAELERLLLLEKNTSGVKGLQYRELNESRFAHCWYRDSCRKWQYMNQSFTFKDLSVVHGKTQTVKRWWTIKNDDYFDQKMNRTVLVDDDPTNFTDNPDHGIPVRPFVADDPGDNTLSKVSLLLYELERSFNEENCVDVRPLLRQRFGLASAFLQADNRFPSFVPNQWEYVMNHVQTVHL